VSAIITSNRDGTLQKAEVGIGRLTLVEVGRVGFSVSCWQNTPDYKMLHVWIHESWLGVARPSCPGPWTASPYPQAPRPSHLSVGISLV